MCGIAGVLTFRDRAVEPSVLARMAARMAFRGPDGERFWVGHGVGLVHRRLSIIDLSSASDCPLGNEDGSIIVVFNGEIYNYKELRRQLIERGHRFRSQGDTETVVHGYEEWGLGVLDRLDGMFAFGLWDACAETLHLARDRLGEKPLYLGTVDGKTYFGSNPTVISAAFDQLPALDLESLDCFLSHSFIPAAHTIFRGIRCLSPGTVESVKRDGSTTVRAYWEFPAIPAKSSRRELPRIRRLEEVERRVEQAVIRAVESRLVADVPVGGLLSGGVDSSLVMAVAARLRPGISTCSIGFEQSRFDERRYARAVAQRIGSNHVERTFGVKDLLAVMPRLVYQYGQPFGDASAIPTALAFDLASSRCKVVLTGDGGDEAFGGYWRVKAARYAEGYRAILPGALRRMTTGLRMNRAVRDRFAIFQRWNRLEAMVGEGHPYTNANSWFEHRHRAYGAQLARTLTCHDPAYCFAQPAAEAGSLVRRVMLRDYRTQLSDGFLVKVDVASMGRGVEARAPFLAPDLVEAAWLLPDALKVGLWKENKWLLKRIAARYVPRNVVYRPKQGFAMPLGDWFRGRLGRLVEALMQDSVVFREGWLLRTAVGQALARHREGREQNETRLWLFTWLELWARMTLDCSLKPSDDLSQV